MALTYLLPAAFFTFTPASSLLGMWDVQTTIASGLVAIIFFWLARRFWKFALANYTSAAVKMGQCCPTDPNYYIFSSLYGFKSFR